MKKIIIYTCTSIAVLLLCLGIIRQRKTISHNENIISFVESDSSSYIPNMPVLKFVNTKYDFGDFKTNKKDSINVFNIDYAFQNVGEAPLIIYKVDVSCGCLSVDFPKEPIIPKGNGVIKVKVNTQNNTGAFNKTLFVRSNATEDVILLRVVGQIK